MLSLRWECLPWLPWRCLLPGVAARGPPSTRPCPPHGHSGHYHVYVSRLPHGAAHPDSERAVPRELTAPQAAPGEAASADEESAWAAHRFVIFHKDRRQKVILTLSRLPQRKGALYACQTVQVTIWILFLLQLISIKGRLRLKPTCRGGPCALQSPVSRLFS